jgi:hypothetical protein
MPHRANRIAFALFLAAIGRSEPARSQTVAPTNQMNPERFVNGFDVGQSTRPINLMPLGINYNDCIEDMTLQFPIEVSGFNGMQSVQIWATKSGDCTQPSARGVGANAVPTCWIVSQGFTGQIINTITTIQFNVRVQDLVGPQNDPPSVPNYVPHGSSACSAQPTFVGVSISIYFVPVDSDLNVVGTPYVYSIPTDLVGPPPPVGVNPQAGNSQFTVNWTPNSDSDTQGYDVFVDPIPGQEDASAFAVDAAATTMLVCPDAGASTQLQGGSTEGGNDGASLDATASPSSDAGCYYEYVGSTSGLTGGSRCSSVVLSSAILQDSGGLIPESGGLSTVPSIYLVGAGGAGLTVSDKNTGTYTIESPHNGTIYNVVVAAVDGSGNIGPPSPQICDYPARSKGSSNLSGQDGEPRGERGGGGCALGSMGEPGPAASGLTMIAAASLLRRRRCRRTLAMPK